MTGKSGTGVSPVSFACDAARNMTRCWGSGFTNQYFYDHARRLIQIVSTNATGGHSTRFVYEGMDVIAKLDETTGEMVYFTRGLGIAPGVGDVLAETHILGSLTQTYLYVQNHRGDTIALVSNSTVVARYEYSAWGMITSNTGVSAFFTFSGKHFDADASLYYYGYRWYDPQAKRWTQPDPSGLAEGLDMYQFCGNDPVNSLDVYGGWKYWNPAAVGRGYIGWLEGYKKRALACLDRNGYAYASAKTLYEALEAPAGLLLLGDNAYDRYQYNVCELGNNPWYAAADAFAMTFFDLFGLTTLGEGAFGVDRATGEILGGVDRTSRMIAGSSCMLLWAAGVTEGVQAGDIGYLRPAETGKLWRPSISENDVGHIFKQGHNIQDIPSTRNALEATARNVNNYVATDEYGTAMFRRTLSDGSQIWVGVRNGKIRYGGVNNTSKY